MIFIICCSNSFFGSLDFGNKMMFSLECPYRNPFLSLKFLSYCVSYHTYIINLKHKTMQVVKELKEG